VVGIQIRHPAGSVGYGTYEYVSKITHTTDHSFTYRIVTDNMIRPTSK